MQELLYNRLVPHILTHLHTRSRHTSSSARNLHVTLVFLNKECVADRWLFQPLCRGLCRTCCRWIRRACSGTAPAGGCTGPSSGRELAASSKNRFIQFTNKCSKRQTSRRSNTRLKKNTAVGDFTKSHWVTFKSRTVKELRNQEIGDICRTNKCSKVRC